MTDHPDLQHENTADETADPGDTASLPDGYEEEPDRGPCPPDIPDAPEE